MTPRSHAVACFDLDGVLADSEAVKIRCWRESVAEVLAPPPDILHELHLYNVSQRGVPRIHKFEFAAKRLGSDATAVSQLLDEYADRLHRGLDDVRALPGSREFVSAWPGTTAVASSAPVAEVATTLDKINIRVEHAFGFPTSKSSALRAFRGSPVVFFGDATADRIAAQESGAAFVAIGEVVDRDEADLAHARTLANLLGEADRLASYGC